MLEPCHDAALPDSTGATSLCLLTGLDRALQRIDVLEGQVATLTAALGQTAKPGTEAVPCSPRAEAAGQVASLPVLIAAHTAPLGDQPTAAAELDPLTPPAASEQLLRSRSLPSFTATFPVSFLSSPPFTAAQVDFAVEGSFSGHSSSSSVAASPAPAEASSFKGPPPDPNVAQQGMSSPALADGGSGRSETGLSQAPGHSSSSHAAAAASNAQEEDSDAAPSPPPRDPTAAEYSCPLAPVSAEGSPAHVQAFSSSSDQHSHGGDGSAAAHASAPSPCHGGEEVHASGHRGGDHARSAPLLLLLPAPEGSASEPLPTEGSTGSEQPAAKGFFSSFGQRKQAGSPSPGPSILATPRKLAASVQAGLRGIAYGVAKKTLPQMFFPEATNKPLTAVRPAAEAIIAEVGPCTCVHAIESNNICAHSTGCHETAVQYRLTPFSVHCLFVLLCALQCSGMDRSVCAS